MKFAYVKALCLRHGSGKSKQEPITYNKDNGFIYVNRSVAEDEDVIMNVDLHKVMDNKERPYILDDLESQRP